MKKIILLIILCLFILALTGCESSESYIREAWMTGDEYLVYQDNEVVASEEYISLLSVEKNLSAISFQKIEEESDIRPETKRGIKIGSKISDLEKSYGDVACRISFYAYFKSEVLPSRIYTKFLENDENDPEREHHLEFFTYFINGESCGAEIFLNYLKDSKISTEEYLENPHKFRKLAMRKLNIRVKDGIVESISIIMWG